jgi:spore coat polysaccharide biosynthesis protein SpsF
MTGGARSDPSEIERLEQLWGGSFGDEYASRNLTAGAGRGPFWSSLLAGYPVATACEVGCNTGPNLDWIADLIGPDHLYAVDVNRDALREVRRRLPDVNAIWGLGRDLPFRDGFVDLAFTTGVLIHQPADSLMQVMAEVVRVSRRYVLAGEYFAATPEEVEYRGVQGALFKRDYGSMYLANFPELELVKHGFLSRADGWDNIDWWLLEKRSRRPDPSATDR